MPPYNAFTGVTKTGENVVYQPGKINALGNWDQGYHFYTKDASSPSTVYFPAIGSRSFSTGELFRVGGKGIYWNGIADGIRTGRCFTIEKNDVRPLMNITRAAGGCVRPVAAQ